MASSGVEALETLAGSLEELPEDKVLTVKELKEIILKAAKAQDFGDYLSRDYE